MPSYFESFEGAGIAKVSVTPRPRKMMKGASSGVRGAQNALAAGNTQQALGIMRGTAKSEYASGKALKSQARSVLERAKK